MQALLSWNRLGNKVPTHGPVAGVGQQALGTLGLDNKV